MNTALAQLEEYELFETYIQTRDADIREEIVKRFVYIAEIVSLKYARNNREYKSGVDYEDIYQVACLGLLYAIDRFRPDAGVRFVSYATPTIFGEVRKYFRDKGFVIKVPSRLYDLFRKAERLKRSGSTDSMSEMARVLGVSEAALYEAYKTTNSTHVKSFESEILDEEDGIAYMDTIGREDSSFLVIENSDFISYCEKQLDKTELEFVKMRFYDELNQIEIGKIMGMTQMQASRFERKILKKLRQLYFGD